MSESVTGSRRPFAREVGGDVVVCRTAPRRRSPSRWRTTGSADPRVGAVGAAEGGAGRLALRQETPQPGLDGLAGEAPPLGGRPGQEWPRARGRRGRSGAGRRSGCVRRRPRVRRPAGPRAGWSRAGLVTDDETRVQGVEEAHQQRDLHARRAPVLHTAQPLAGDAGGPAELGLGQSATTAQPAIAVPSRGSERAFKSVPLLSMLSTYGDRYMRVKVWRHGCGVITRRH